MAKLKAPFFSLEARGAFASTIVINTVGGQAIARRLRRHADARSPAQLVQRNLFEGAIEYWHTLTPAEKQVYHDIDPQIGANPAYLNFIRSWLMGTVPTHGDEHGKDGADPIGTELEEGAHPATVYTLPNSHNLPFFAPYPKGRYLVNPFSSVPSTSTAAAAANRLYASPFPITQLRTADRIGFFNTSALAGKKGRLGIYSDNGFAYPGALLLDAGEVDLTTAAQKDIAISQTLPPALYWLALVMDSNPGIYRVPNNSLSIVGHTNAQGGRASWYHAFNYAALPDPYPTAAPLTSLQLWLIALRFT